MLFRTIRAAFGQRRKTLSNALSAGLGDFSKAEIGEAIRAAGMEETIRGERLDIHDFARLADELYTIKSQREA